MRRWMLLLVCILLAIGCAQRRGGLSGQWGARGEFITADIKDFTATRSGGDTVNFLTTAGHEDQVNVWAGELAYASGTEVYGAGYMKVGGAGSATLSKGVTFGGTTFPKGTNVMSRSDFDIYKVSVANRAQAGQQTATTNQFAFVLEFIDFDIRLTDDATPPTLSAGFSNRSMMLLLGYEWEAQAGSGGASYYAKIEWMDLDVIRLGSTGGNFTDLSAGLKYSFGGPQSRTQLVIGYRYFDADLKIKGDNMRLHFDGPTVGLHASF